MRVSALHYKISGAPRFKTDNAVVGLELANASEAIDFDEYREIGWVNKEYLQYQLLM